MIGVVVVSHSPELARASVDLALEMVHGERPAISIAAGVIDGATGTDATAIAASITEVASPDGVLVLVDLGSAVLSASLALELVDLPGIDIRVTSAPFVEGLMAGLVRAAAGASLDEVEREARESLASKRSQLGDPEDVPDETAPHGELALDLRLRNESGLHIRPASMLVLALAPFDATVTIANLRTGSGPRQANSPTKLLTLAAQRGDVIRVIASGPEAQAALDLVRTMVADGFGELQPAAPSAPTGAVRGGPLGVSPGRAVGPVVQMPEPLDAPPAAGPIPSAQRASEADRIDLASAAVSARLRARSESVEGDSRAVLEAAAVLAADPATVEDARTRVLVDGESPALAVWTTFDEQAIALAGLGGRMAERVADLHDIRNRIVAELMGRETPGVPVRTEPFVLVARDLAPADTALIDPATCVAIVTVEGGPTSHTAILSRSLGLPAVVLVENALQLANGTTVLVDGTAGTIAVEPTEAQVAEVRAESAVVVEFDGLGQTSDGHRVQLLANVASPASVAAATGASAEGVGLFRTEFLFLDRAEAPSVEEQTAAYAKVFAAFPGKRVIVRTLDAGADKPLAFVPATHEANPALGVRGYRATWRNPHLIDDQLRAIAAAAEDSAAIVEVMAPMIDTPDEAEDFATRCAEHGLTAVGVMIETPAAAITSPEIFRRVDFVSLGTNDLTQYTMAADRELGDLAVLSDPWQPAVLRMLRIAFEAGASAGKPVSVCGEAASDPMLAAVLVGLGASSLSMSPRALGHVGQLLGGVTLAECRDAASGALAAESAAAARAAAASALGVGS